MGHNRLGGGLPRTKRWIEVINLVGQGGSPEQVADATLDATEGQFFAAADDPVVVRTVWLLTQLPDAARVGDFAANLRALGMDVADSPSSTELASALGRAVDTFATSLGQPRSDLAEMARLSAMETVAAAAFERSPGLFGLNPDAARTAVAQIYTEQKFGVFARDFFARLTERTLVHYVSRELPLHVGSGERFETATEQRAFQDAVATHARQASKIVETFAGGWYSKARFQRDLTPERTARFIGYSMKKLRAELRLGAK